MANFDGTDLAANGYLSQNDLIGCAELLFKISQDFSTMSAFKP